VTGRLPGARQAAGRYERLRPPAAGVAARSCVEVHLLQSCGLAWWAQTCCGSSCAATAGGGTDLSGVPASSLEPAGDSVRSPMVAILASMVLHQRNGGSHDDRRLAVVPRDGLLPA
jgi:hypothetical protein